MPTETTHDGERRRFLRRSSLFAGAGLALGSIALAHAAATKMAPGAVAYQSKPQGSARCDKCKSWEPPASCKIVSGPIDAAGWCTLFAQKT